MDDGSRHIASAQEVARLTEIAAEDRDLILRLEILLRARGPLDAEATHIADAVHDTRSALAAVEAWAETFAEARRAGRAEGREHWFGLGYAQGLRDAASGTAPDRRRATVVPIRPLRAITA